MLVSIIIPNFNKGNFISDTLKSVMGQRYREFEVLIVDDGSTDHSMEVCKPFVEADKRFAILKSDHIGMGASYCRNLALMQAKGEYVFFLDSDDLITERCLEIRVAAYSYYENLDFMVFPTGTFFSTIGDSKSIWKTQPHENHLLNFLRHDLPWNISGPLWKRSFLIELGGFDPSFRRLQDVELHSRALLKQKVRYYIARNHTIDFFYRIDMSRLNYDHPKFIQLFIEGILAYVLKMKTLLAQLPQKESKYYLKALRGSIISALAYIQVNHQRKKIDGAFKKFLIKLLLNNPGVRELFSSASWSLTLNYLNGLDKGFNIFKGFNYLIKKAIINV